MAFIQNEEHFLNYLNKALKQNPDVDFNLCLSGNFYVKEIYAAGFADEYTWALKQEGAHLLEEKAVLAWLAKQRTMHIRECVFSHYLTKGFIELLEDLSNICGVYSFWNVDQEPLYVGRSIRLGQRMASSFGERFHNYDRAVYVRYIQTNSAPDASIMEIYFIATLNPPFNRQDNYAAEELTLTVELIPDWSEPIQCNLVTYEDQETNNEQEAI